jgi:two-component system, NarL family, sensor histidine kinase UhpB
MQSGTHRTMLSAASRCPRLLRSGSSPARERWRECRGEGTRRGSWPPSNASLSALRLPVVDDLGAGPALEWLTERVGRLAGTEIELERADDGRPPIDVEHAVFRVAQEALANAARHGRPPIRVRYEADASHTSLVVRNAGARSAVEAEEGLGLVGMRERAHAIGADLEIGSSGDGTRVALMWPAVAS